LYHYRSSFVAPGFPGAFYYQNFVMHTPLDIFILHLSLISDIGPSPIDRICAHVPSICSIADVYAMSVRDCVHYFGCTQAQATAIVAGLEKRSTLDDELRLIEKSAISWVTSYAAGYPSILKSIACPPAVLYMHGAALGDAENRMAVIGSRKADDYGQHAINTLVPPLVEQGWVIVSGGARGADTMAHRATLQANGRTVAVLGSGLLRPYPASNIRLFKEIAEKGGTVISAFPLMMDAIAGNFPARNRIISGLSRGCVVVQAAEKSGASITAHCALEQGRDVFAVPGPIFSELSAGCHALIREGAKITTSAQDILQEYGQLAPSLLRQTDIFKEMHKTPQAVTVTLPGIQGVIYKACMQQATSLEDLLELTQLSLPELNAMLFEMQVAGRMEQNFAGLWHSVR
jgi:DNA processing protein